MITLGTPVTYHHRAAVARWQPPGKGDFSWRKGWTLYEGVRKHAVNDAYVQYTEMFSRWPEIKGRRDKTINKTVMVWPEDGSGVVIGRVRRGRGTSESGRHYGDGEYDQGWFSAESAYHLYVVRHSLDGLQDYILVPEWAVRPIHREDS